MNAFRFMNYECKKKEYGRTYGMERKMEREMKYQKQQHASSINSLSVQSIVFYEWQVQKLILDEAHTERAESTREKAF